MPINKLINLTVKSELIRYCGVSWQPMRDWQEDNEIKKSSDLKKFIAYFRELVEKVDKAIDTIDIEGTIQVKDVPIKKSEIIECCYSDALDDYVRPDEYIVNHIDELETLLIERAKELEDLLFKLIIDFIGSKKFLKELWR